MWRDGSRTVILWNRREVGTPLFNSSALSYALGKLHKHVAPLRIKGFHDSGRDVIASRNSSDAANAFALSRSFEFAGCWRPLD
jgi:hypothetical protein